MYEARTCHAQIGSDRSASIKLAGRRLDSLGEQAPPDNRLMGRDENHGNRLIAEDWRIVVHNGSEIFGKGFDNRIPARREIRQLAMLKEDMCA